MLSSSVTFVVSSIWRMLIWFFSSSTIFVLSVICVVLLTMVCEISEILFVFSITVCEYFLTSSLTVVSSLLRLVMRVVLFVIFVVRSVDNALMSPSR